MHTRNSCLRQLHLPWHDFLQLHLISFLQGFLDLVDCSKRGCIVHYIFPIPIQWDFCNCVVSTDNHFTSFLAMLLLEHLFQSFKCWWYAFYRSYSVRKHYLPSNAYVVNISCSTHGGITEKEMQLSYLFNISI